MTDAGTLFSCKDLVAVISGAGSGLGSYAAKALDANGAKAVYIIGRRKESLEATVKQCKNGSARAIVGDVTSKESLANAAEQIKKEIGYVNVVFANSGVVGTAAGSRLDKDYSLEQFQKTMWEAPMEDFTNAFAVNCSGAFYTAVAFLELLDAGNKKGNVYQKSQIVVTASVAGLSRLPTTGFDYSASKAAAIHITKQFSTSLSKFKIRANAIAPGFYPSEMVDKHPLLGGGIDPTVEGNVPLSISPLGRIGSENDFAGAILYLFSPAGSFINGNVLVTDGGRLSTLPAAY